MGYKKDYYSITLLDGIAPVAEREIHGDAHYFARLDRNTDHLQLTCIVYGGEPNKGAPQLVSNHYRIDNAGDACMVAYSLGDHFMASPNYAPYLVAALLESCLEPFGE